MLPENVKLEQYAKAMKKENAKKRAQTIAKALKQLSPSEKIILEMAFGLRSRADS